MPSPVKSTILKSSKPSPPPITSKGTSSAVKSAAKQSPARSIIQTKASRDDTPHPKWKHLHPNSSELDPDEQVTKPLTRSTTIKRLFAKTSPNEPIDTSELDPGEKHRSSHTRPDISELDPGERAHISTTRPPTDTGQSKKSKPATSSPKSTMVLRSAKPRPHSKNDKNPLPSTGPQINKTTSSYIPDAFTSNPTSQAKRHKFRYSFNLASHHDDSSTSTGSSITILTPSKMKSTTTKSPADEPTNPSSNINRSNSPKSNRPIIQDVDHTSTDAVVENATAPTNQATKPKAATTPSTSPIVITQENTTPPKTGLTQLPRAVLYRAHQLINDPFTTSTDSVDEAKMIAQTPEYQAIFSTDATVNSKPPAILRLPVKPPTHTTEHTLKPPPRQQITADNNTQSIKLEDIDIHNPDLDTNYDTEPTVHDHVRPPTPVPSLHAQTSNNPATNNRDDHKPITQTPPSWSDESSSSGSSLSISLPSLDDIHVTHNDVLFGRGENKKRHPGNIQFRAIADNLRPAYCAAKKADKKKFTRHVLLKIHSLDPPGRFLKENERGDWYEVDDTEARKKTGQVLREKLPEYKAQLTEYKAQLLRKRTHSPRPSLPPNKDHAIKHKTSSDRRRTPTPIRSETNEFPGRPVADAFPQLPYKTYAILTPTVNGDDQFNTTATTFNSAHNLNFDKFSDLVDPSLTLEKSSNRRLMSLIPTHLANSHIADAIKNVFSHPHNAIAIFANGTSPAEVVLAHTPRVFNPLPDIPSNTSRIITFVVGQFDDATIVKCIPTLAFTTESALVPPLEYYASTTFQDILQPAPPELLKSRLVSSALLLPNRLTSLIYAGSSDNISSPAANVATAILKLVNEDYRQMLQDEDLISGEWINIAKDADRTDVDPYGLNNNPNAIINTHKARAFSPFLPLLSTLYAVIHNTPTTERPRLFRQGLSSTTDEASTAWFATITNMIGTRRFDYNAALQTAGLENIDLRQQRTSILPPPSSSSDPISRRKLFGNPQPPPSPTAHSTRLSHRQQQHQDDSRVDHPPATSDNLLMLNSEDEYDDDDDDLPDLEPTHYKRTRSNSISPAPAVNKKTRRSSTIRQPTKPRHRTYASTARRSNDLPDDSSDLEMSSTASDESIHATHYTRPTKTSTNTVRIVRDGFGVRNNDHLFKEAVMGLTKMVQSNERWHKLSYKQQEEQFRKREEKNLPDAVVQFHRNASTVDGINPRPDLTASDRTYMLTTKATDVKDLLEADLKAHGCMADLPLPLVKVIHTGRWANRALQPGGLCIMGTPCSLDNTAFGSIDIHQTAADYDAGRNVSDRALQAMNRFTAIFPRTIHYLIEQTKNFGITLTYVCGEDAIATVQIKKWYDWMTDNRQTLMDIHRKLDNDLPVKIAWHIFIIYNNYWNSALTVVPNPSLLESDFIRNQLLTNTYNITLPPELSDSMSSRRNRNRNPRRQPQPGNPRQQRMHPPAAPSTAASSRQTASTQVTNQNQLPALRVSPQIYNLGIGPPIARRAVTAPMWNGIGDCARWHTRGFCNQNCPRASNHTPITEPTRERGWVNFRNGCRDWYNANKRQTDPDFG